MADSFQSDYAAEQPLTRNNANKKRAERLEKLYQELCAMEDDTNADQNQKISKMMQFQIMNMRNQNQPQSMCGNMGAPMMGGPMRLRGNSGHFGRPNMMQNNMMSRFQQPMMMNMPNPMMGMGNNRGMGMMQTPMMNQHTMAQQYQNMTRINRANSRGNAPQQSMNTNMVNLMQSNQQNMMQRVPMAPHKVMGGNQVFGQQPMGNTQA